MRKRYEPLVAHVNHRADLTYVIGEMIAELDVGPLLRRRRRYAQAATHSRRACSAPSSNRMKRRSTTRSPRSCPAPPGKPSIGSPLTEIGVNVSEGEYIMAVNGQPTNEMGNIYESLVNTVGKQVRLKVSKEPAEKEEPGGRRRADRRRAAALLLQLGAGQHQEGERRHGRQGRLRAHSRHVGQRPERVRQALLSAARARKPSSSTCAAMAAATFRR